MSPSPADAPRHAQWPGTVGTREVAAPPLSPGSARRTMVHDSQRPLPGQGRSTRGVGRDVMIGLDGEVELVTEASYSLAISTHMKVESAHTVPALPGIGGLVGQRPLGGFRRAVVEAGGRSGPNVLFTMLDDVPGVIVISGGSVADSNGYRDAAASMTFFSDICSGWVSGGGLHTNALATGEFWFGSGPLSPEIAFEARWAPPVLPLEPGWSRRMRRFDLRAGERPGEPMSIDGHFRDEMRGESEAISVIHEYTVTALVDPTTTIVLEVSAVAHELPGPECPLAASSVERVVGHRLVELHGLVRDQFKGVGTCTHLTDHLAAMSGLVDLIEPVLRVQANVPGVS